MASLVFRRNKRWGFRKNLPRIITNKNTTEEEKREKKETSIVFAAVYVFQYRSDAANLIINLQGT